jgi:hypothetical protein
VAPHLWRYTTISPQQGWRFPLTHNVLREPPRFGDTRLPCPGSMAACDQPPTAATPVACVTARPSNTSVCRPAHYLPSAAPKPRSPISSAWPARTSAAGTPLARWRPERAAQRRPHRAGPAPVGCPAGRHRPGPAPGCRRARLRHRPLDPGPHHHRDRAADRGRLPSRPRHPPPIQAEAGIHGRRPVLRLTWRRRGPRLPPPGRRLQQRHPDRCPGPTAPLHCRAQKATLLWDGLPAHRSLAMRTWLRRQRSWLVVEPLPGYAPELNPVEALWSNLKGVEPL